MLSLLYGRGSADDATTPEDESYIGETPGFAPDLLFLSALPAAFDSPGKTIVGRSLRNKRYLGIQFTTTAASPLAWIATRLLHIAESDIRSRASTGKLHDYKLLKPVFGSRDAAREASLEFQVESPRGIKVTVGGGYLFAGDALRNALHRRLWTLTSNVSFKL